MNVTSPLDLSTMPVTGMNISPGKVLYFYLAGSLNGTEQIILYYLSL